MWDYRPFYTSLESEHSKVSLAVFSSTSVQERAGLALCSTWQAHNQEQTKLLRYPTLTLTLSIPIYKTLLGLHKCNAQVLFLWCRHLRISPCSYYRFVNVAGEVMKEVLSSARLPYILFFLGLKWAILPQFLIFYIIVYIHQVKLTGKITKVTAYFLHFWRDFIFEDIIKMCYTCYII